MAPWYDLPPNCSGQLFWPFILAIYFGQVVWPGGLAKWLAKWFGQVVWPGVLACACAISPRLSNAAVGKMNAVARAFRDGSDPVDFGFFLVPRGRAIEALIRCWRQMAHPVRAQKLVRAIKAPRCEKMGKLHVINLAKRERTLAASRAMLSTTWPAGSMRSINAALCPHGNTPCATSPAIRPRWEAGSPTSFSCIG